MPLATRLGALTAVTALLAPAPCFAQGSGRLSVAARARPLTLPVGTLALDGALSIHREPSASGLLTTAMSLGASWAPSDDVELSVVAIALALSPRIAFGVATLGGYRREAALGIRWRFVRGAVQAGFSLRATMRGEGDLVFGVEPSVPVQITLGRGRLDANLGARLELASPVRSEVSLRLGYLFQVSPQIALTASTGAVLEDLGRDLRVPAGVTGLYTIASAQGAPLVDVSLSLEFERLVDATSGAARLDLYTVMGAARFFAR
jgi:hypothetical protein